MIHLKLYENFNTDEIQSNIKDILLHIEDKGINTFVYTWVESLGTEGRKKVNMLSISIDTIDSDLNSTFTIDDDLFSTLEHIKSYLDSEDYILSSISLRAKESSDGYYSSVPHFDCDDLDELKRLSYDSFEYIQINFSHKSVNT